MNDTIIIHTGMNDLVSKSILNNDLGQLSDGMWENSSTMAHYWPYVEIEMVDKEVCIVIYKPGSSCKIFLRENNCFNNWFVRMDKMDCDITKIKKWFAGKIKAIVNENAKDYPNRGIKFNAKCDADLDYMSMMDADHNYRDHKVSEAYAVYKALNA